MVSIAFPLVLLGVLWQSASGLAENLTAPMDIFGDQLPDDLNVVSVVQDLVAHLGSRLRCAQYGLKQTECSSCLQAGQVLQLLQIRPDQRFLTKQEVAGLSILFLHHALHFSSLCKVEPPGCSDFSLCRDEIFLQMRTGDRLESLETILREIDGVLEPGPVHECFNAENVLTEVRKSHYINEEEEMGQIITILMKHIFKGQCINVEESLTDFLDDIFHTYGERCSPVIDVNGLKRIMHDLQNSGAQIHDHHEHGDHGHHSHEEHDQKSHKHDNHHHHEHDHYHHGGDCDGDSNIDQLHPHDHSDGHEHDFHELSEPIHKHDGRDLHPTNDHVERNSESFPPHMNHKRVFFPLSDAEKFDKIIEHEWDLPNASKSAIYNVGSEESDKHEPPNASKSNIYNVAETESDKYRLPNASRRANGVIGREESNKHIGEVVEPNERFLNDGNIREETPTVGKNDRDSETNQTDSPSSTLSPNVATVVYDNNYSLLTTNVNNISNSFDNEMITAFFNLSSSSSDGDERLSEESNINSEPTVAPSDESPILSALVSDLSPSDFSNDDLSAVKSELYHQAETRGGGNGIRFDNDGSERANHLEREEMTTHLETIHLEREGELHHHHVSLSSKCLSAEELVSTFGRVSNNSLTKSEFMQLCPALVQQIVSGVCHTRVPVVTQNQPTKWELYGYSTLAVFVISLTSLGGVVFLPILAKQSYYYVMAGCIGLAFSTLAGDAFLHLIPQSMGLHSHGEDGDHSHDHDDSGDPVMWKQLAVFGAVYLLYLFEATLCVFSKKSQHTQSHGHSHIPESLPKELTLVSIKVKSDSNTQLAMSPERSTSLDTEIADIDVIKKPNVVLATPLFCGLSTVAWLITLGDSIHNFGDGLAIGAAFSSGMRSGISTSIAVFCHELPHEFGDFVILLSSGLSFSKALWINFLTGLTCLVGLYIGIQLGVNEIARSYILAVTAGIFLYVALTEMLPQLKENMKGNPVKMLLVKNFGILLGITIMVLMSVYEHHFYL